VIGLDWNISDDIERAWITVGAASAAAAGAAAGASPDGDCGGGGGNGGSASTSGSGGDNTLREEEEEEEDDDGEGDGGLLVLCSDLVFGNAFEGLIELLVGLQTEQQQPQQQQQQQQQNKTFMSSSSSSSAAGRDKEMKNVNTKKMEKERVIHRRCRRRDPRVQILFSLEEREDRFEK